MKKLSYIASQIAALSVLAVSKAQAQGNTVQVAITPPNQFVPGGNITIDRVISFALGLLLAIGVLAAVGFLIWGGIKWITSGGDKGKVDGARSTIVAAVIGLIVLLLSFVILSFVIQILGVGNNIFDIRIPKLQG
jgi:hypothetical protein